LSVDAWAIAFGGAWGSSWSGSGTSEPPPPPPIELSETTGGGGSPSRTKLAKTLEARRARQREERTILATIKVFLEIMDDET
jgi:hypothetical protein